MIIFSKTYIVQKVMCKNSTAVIIKAVILLTSYLRRKY